MDTINQTPPPQSYQPPVAPITPEVPKPKSKGPLILAIVAGAILLAGLGALAWVYFSAQPTASPTPTPSASQSATPTASPSTSPTAGSSSVIDSEWMLYTNTSLGLSIRYPKISDVTSKCVTTANGPGSVSQPTDLKIFEDFANNAIYLGPVTWAVNTPKQVSPGVYYGNTSCDVKVVTLETVKNGFDVGIQNNLYPPRFRFDYRRGTSSGDLLELAQTYGSRCQLGEQQLVDPVKQIYKVGIVGDTPDANGELPANPCFMNFAFEFFYSKPANIAVTWAIGQDNPWGLNGKVYDVSVGFLK